MAVTAHRGGKKPSERLKGSYVGPNRITLPAEVTKNGRRHA